MAGERSEPGILKFLVCFFLKIYIFVRLLACGGDSGQRPGLGLSVCVSDIFLCEPKFLFHIFSLQPPKFLRVLGQKNHFGHIWPYLAI